MGAFAISCSEAGDISCLGRLGVNHIELFFLHDLKSLKIAWRSLRLDRSGYLHGEKGDAGFSIMFFLLPWLTGHINVEIFLLHIFQEREGEGPHGERDGGGVKDLNLPLFRHLQ